MILKGVSYYGSALAFVVAFRVLSADALAVRCQILLIQTIFNIHSLM